MRRTKLAMAVSACSIMLITSGCANMQQTFKENAGKIGGVVLGAATGALACDGDPACIAAGAFTGLVLGDLYDKRQEKLRKLAKEKNINLETKTVTTFNSDEENGLELAINEGGMFEVGSAELKTPARMDLMTVATVYRDEPQKILIIGHTDATGPDTFNQRLSEKRARTVAELFQEVGVPANQIYFQGAGEAQPVATNDTKTGRSSNRRVEVVEIDSEESLAAYNLQRKNNSKYLAHSNRTNEERAEIRRQVESTPKIAHAPESEQKVAETEPKSPASTPDAKAKVDFGGAPASGDFSQILLATGDTKEESGIGFSLFPKAVASAPPTNLSPCYMEAPRVTGDIQNLGTGKKLEDQNLNMADYWPGLNGNVWLDTVNGHMVAYQDLRVMRDSAAPQGKPTVRVYEDIKQDKEADFVAQPHIESYPGENGLLLRAYFNESEPMQCMDFVMPNRGTGTAKAGVLYYAKGQGIYEQKIQLSRLK